MAGFEPLFHNYDSLAIMYSVGVPAERYKLVNINYKACTEWTGAEMY